MSVPPELSVVIPTCGRPVVLGDTLTSLRRQRCDAAGIEAFVVLDGEDAASRRVIEEAAQRMPFPLMALSQPRSGAAAARNIGIARARGRIVLMLDDDIIADPGLFAAHLRHHAGRSDCVVIGALPVEPLPDEPAHHRALRLWWDQVLADLATPGRKPAFEDFVTGNVSVSRELLVRVGGFDAAFSEYGREDYELGYRLLQAGADFVYEPAARGLHRYRKDLHAWLRQFEPQGRADVKFVRKHPALRYRIMTLSPFPVVPWIPRLVRLAERIAADRNDRGGLLWRRAASMAQAAYYWNGIRTGCAGAEEYSALVRAQLAGLRLERGGVGLSYRVFARLGDAVHGSRRRREVRP